MRTARNRPRLHHRVPVRAWLAMGVVVTACSDGRPGIDTARADFEKRYPDATALEVRVSEDEVVARSFQMRYRVRSSGPGKCPRDPVHGGRGGAMGGATGAAPKVL